MNPPPDLQIITLSQARLGTIFVSMELARFVQSVVQRGRSLRSLPLTDFRCRFHFRLAGSTPEKDVGLLYGAELHWPWLSDDWPHQLLAQAWIWWYTDCPGVLSRHYLQRMVRDFFFSGPILLEHGSPFLELGTCKWHLQVRLPGRTIFGRDIIPICDLWNKALFPGRNFLNAAMTSLCDAVARWYVCESQQDPPFLQELFDLLATEGGGHCRLISILVHLVRKRLTIVGE